ncbi:MAG: MotA/TolQ/ExbB proton channel family protein [Planctomycetia bacterium]
MEQFLTLYFKYWSSLDRLILLAGAAVLASQVIGALWLRGSAPPPAGRVYEAQRSRYLFLARVAAAAVDAFPLLGLLGTVSSLLVAFAGVGAAGVGGLRSNIISDFAPALTTTISGLVTALVNLLVYQLFLLPAVQERFDED